MLQAAQRVTGKVERSTGLSASAAKLPQQSYSPDRGPAQSYPSEWQSWDLVAEKRGWGRRGRALQPGPRPSFSSRGIHLHTLMGAVPPCKIGESFLPGSRNKDIFPNSDVLPFVDASGAPDAPRSAGPELHLC